MEGLIAPGYYPRSQLLQLFYLLLQGASKRPVSALSNSFLSAVA